MSLQKFLNLIDKTPFGALVSRQEALLEKTDPDRIYVENVRAFFSIPFSVAQSLCDLAVRERIFIRKLGLACPNEDRILLVVDSQNEAPETVNCAVCEANEREPHEFNRDQLKPIVFYMLND
jgi:hypothetical protein